LLIKNTNDGTNREPYLRCDICASNLHDLPAFSTGPKGSERQILEGIKAAGIQGVQDANADLCRELGLGVTGSHRVNRVGEIEPVAAKAKAEGRECMTLHVGWGMESEAETYRLVEDVLNTSEKYDLPLYIETHRATITQDIWRTIEIVKKFPEIRFNGDFSHWYTGLEMTNGGFENKMAFLAPVFERVRFIQARIGNSGSIQVDIGDGKNLPYVEHFKEMWTRSFAGFLASAQGGDYFCFAPELLSPTHYYARILTNAAGEIVEEGDRWQQALLYLELARECFEQAKAGSVNGG
jgi:hypothetical protein